MEANVTVLNSFGILKCSGAKTQEFLQGQLTCDMRELTAHGKYSFAAACDHRGRMLANFWVIRWQNDFLLAIPKSLSETVRNHLQKYAVFSKVEITHDNHLFIAETNIRDSENDIFISLPSENRFLHIAEKNNFPNISINADETTWKKNNIIDQLAILCDKTSLLFTPQMINLEKLGGVSFTKGCYVGQEIVARTQHVGTLKRHLHRIQIKSDATLQPGDELKNEKDEAIGVIIEAVTIANNQVDVLAVIQDHAITSFSTL